MKIKRHNLEEKNKITSLWLYEFAHDLEKNAAGIDYLKDYLNKNKKNTFLTIEEKLSDIRSRVGLDLAIKISNEMDQISQKKSHQCECKIEHSCQCEIKTASVHSVDDVEMMKNILSYINDIIKHEPHLDVATILSKLKNEENLGFDRLEKKIDRSKLIKHINDLLSLQNPKTTPSVRYTPDVSVNELDNEDLVADYYHHAEPSAY